MEALPIPEDQQDRILTALGQCPLFRALKPEHLPQVAKLAELNRFAPEEPIVRQGEVADSFFILLKGHAAVTVDRGGEALEIGQMSAPATVGELGLLLAEKRTASVVASSPVEALKFGTKAFEAMFQKIPNFGMGISQGLAQRLQQVSGRVQLPDWDERQPHPSADVVSMLPVEMQQRHRVLPLQVDGKFLTLGFVDDPTPQVMNAVREALPTLEFRPVHIGATLFNEVLKKHSGVKGWGDSGKVPVLPEAKRSPKLDVLLERMVAEGASDLHLSAGNKPFWRVDGEMSAMQDLPALSHNEVYELLSPVMSERHITEFNETHDTDLGYSVPNVARFRVNVFRDNLGVGAVMRQIPSKILTFEQLSLPNVLRQFCEIPKGLVLVTGPTGSGKSTTLAAMIDYINKNQSSHIITLEDPIEFVHQTQKCLINQREVGGHTQSFGRALRAALREDPDIVLVGELRDLETISLALETANTGHLVFGTLHTNSAISSVDRIIDQFEAGQQDQVRTVLADVLRGVVSQTLLKKKAGGRIAALEVLVVSFAAANLIREGKIHQLTSVMQSGKQMGNQLMNDELARLFDEKKVDFEEAYAAAVDKDELTRRYRAGLTLAADPPAYQAFRVMDVKPDTPAAAAGLARGDMIVEINKKPAKDFSLDDMRSMLRTDGKYVFQVEKTGKRREVIMELKRLL